MSKNITIRTLIGYHANCIDGFTAAWVTYNALTKMGDTCKLIALEYNKESEDALLTILVARRYEDLYIVDFSLSLDFLEELQKEFPSTHVTILDHHKTAFEKYVPEVAADLSVTSNVQCSLKGADIILDNNQSGASLCWKYFNPKEKPPTLVKYVKDYDLWRFQYGENTKFVNMYLRTLDKTIAAWNLTTEQCENDIEYVYNLGRHLQKKHNATVIEIAQHCNEITIAGKKGLAVECRRAYTSDVGHALATQSGTFGAMFTVDVKTNIVTWSLRSNGDYDVSAIAKQFGGGGHRNAAGFESISTERLDYVRA